jgi:hypothetical protein
MCRRKSGRAASLAVLLRHFHVERHNLTRDPADGRDADAENAVYTLKNNFGIDASGGSTRRRPWKSTVRLSGMMNTCIGFFQHAV